MVDDDVSGTSHVIRIVAGDLKLATWPPPSVLGVCVCICYHGHRGQKSGSRIKGGLSKGAFCAKQTFLQENGLPSAVLQGNGLPSAVVTRHPLGLGKSVQSRFRTGLGSCKSHLQVETPQGRSLASASGSGQAIDLCFERSPFR